MDIIPGGSAGKFAGRDYDIVLRSDAGKIGSVISTLKGAALDLKLVTNNAPLKMSNPCEC